MSRLIDADALKDELNAWARVIMKPTLMGSDEVMCVIDHAPTIDAVPVVHSEWIKMSDRYGEYYACNNCGYDRVNHKSNYCPTCGAKMDGKRDK